MKHIQYFFKHNQNKTRIILLLIFLLITVIVESQPHVNADRSVTFKVFAPKADSVKTEVDIIYEYTKYFDIGSNRGVPMVRDADGIWSVTIGPLEPDPYLYNIQIDGRSMPDAGHTWYAWRYYLSEKFLPNLWN